MGVDGTAANAVEALELAGCPQIVPLDVEVKEAKWNDEQSERRGGD